MTESSNRYAIDCWYPAGTESLSDSGITLKLNPKYLVPQFFWTADRLADPCFTRAKMPEWACSEKTHDELFPTAPKGLTTNLMFVDVTPRVWVWCQWVVRAMKNTGKFKRFQHDVLTGPLIENYCRNRLNSDVLGNVVGQAEDYIRAGGRGNGLLPEPEPVLYDLVRFGLVEPWDGFEQWKGRLDLQHSSNDDTESKPSLQQPPKPSRTPRSLMPRESRSGPALF